MGQNDKAKLYIVGALAFVLGIAACVTLFVLRNKEPEKHNNQMDYFDYPTGQSVDLDAIRITQPSDADDYSSYPLNNAADCQAVIDAYAADHGIDPFSYPIEITNLLMTNHETLDFVLHFPELAGSQDGPDYPGTIDLGSDFTPLRVPEYYQFDTRWGYKTYAGNVMAVTGSGPTALSMVASYLTGNSDMNPAWMAAYAENNGYTMEGGTSWSLMADGAVGLGIDVTPITADQDRIERNLDVGNLVVCLMGPGDFTSTAQYIIIVGYSEAGYEIRDPGSPARTAVTWQFDTLAPQMNGCWIMRIL